MQYGRIDAARLLIELGADINAPDSSGEFWPSLQKFEIASAAIKGESPVKAAARLDAPVREQMMLLFGGSPRVARTRQHPSFSAYL